MIGGGDPFYLKFLVKLTALEPIFYLFFARGASAVTSSEKGQLSLIGSPLYALSTLCSTFKRFKISKRLLHHTIRVIFLVVLMPNFVVVSLGVRPELVC